MTKNPGASELRRLYVDEKLSSAAIAEHCGVTAHTAYTWLVKANIPIRSRSEAVASHYTKRRQLEAPTENELKALYWTERLTTREIAERYNTSHMTVKRWLRKHGVERRQSSDFLTHRGIRAPTADELYRMVHLEHKSYREIASSYGVHETSIGNWLKAHGIEKPTVWETRRNGEYVEMPDRDTLYKLYTEDHLSTTVIGDMYGVSDTTIGTLLKDHGIAKRPDGFQGKRFVCKDGHEVRSLYEQRVDDWLYDHGVAHEYEPPLPFDRRMKSDFLANGYYIEVWGVTNNARYAERQKRKRAEYKAHGLPLIEIPVHAFATSRNAMWARRLKKCLIPSASPITQLTLDVNH